MKTYSFAKWEGFSYETRTDGETEEFYPTEVWDGEITEEQFLAKHLAGCRVVKHTYRYLEYSEDDYDAGESTTSCFEVSAEGSVTPCEMWEDYWD